MNSILNRFCLISLAALGLIVSSCKKEANDIQPLSGGPKITASEVHFPNTASEGFIEFEGAGVQVEVSKDAAWLTYTLSGNRVSLKASYNPDPIVRSTELVLKNAGGSTPIQVMQLASVNDFQIPAVVEFSEEASTQTFPAILFTEPVITIPDEAKDWLAVERTGEGEISFTVKAATEPKTRAAEVTIVAGNTSSTITVKQLGIFKVEDVPFGSYGLDKIVGDYTLKYTLKSGQYGDATEELPVSLVEGPNKQTLILKGLAIDLVVELDGDSLRMRRSMQRLPLNPYVTMMYISEDGGGQLLNDADVALSARHQMVQEHMYYKFASKYMVLDIAKYFATGEQVKVPIAGFLFMKPKDPNVPNDTDTYTGPDPNNPKPAVMANLELTKVDPMPAK